MLILRANSKVILPIFVFLFFQSKFAKDQIESLISGAAQPQLPIRTLVDLQIPIPSIEIQHSIVEEIQREKLLVESNSQLIDVFQSKIDTAIAKVWGDSK